MFLRSTISENFIFFNSIFKNISFLYILVTSPKKSLKSPKKGKKLSRKESDKAAATTKEVKNEKALYSINPKNISKEDIAKWIKSGDVDKMELAVLAGKGMIYIQLGKKGFNKPLFMD